MRALSFLAALPFVISVPPLLIWFGLVMVVALAASLMPAARASALTVREALATT